MLFEFRSRKKCARLHRMRCTKTYDVGVTLGRVCAACGTEVVRVRHRFRANLEKNAGIRYKSFAILTRGRDFFSGPFADRGSSTRFLTFFATF